MLAACGSNGSGSSASGSGSGSGSTGSAEVSTSDVSGVGTVLVDSAGKTLYVNNQEQGGGALKCTSSCLDFWTPAQATGTMPNIQGLGTITRSDNGDKQLTFHGAPLYTFTLDTSAGSAKGNDFQDSFGGTSFTWDAATTSGSASNMGSSSGSGESGEYGNTGSGSGSGSGSSSSNSNPYGGGY